MEIAGWAGVVVATWQTECPARVDCSHTSIDGRHTTAMSWYPNICPRTILPSRHLAARHPGHLPLDGVRVIWVRVRVMRVKAMVRG